jgi:pimeloyl-ACP methyl ester carboxylesterase
LKALNLKKLAKIILGALAGGTFNLSVESAPIAPKTMRMQGADVGVKIYVKHHAPAKPNNMPPVLMLHGFGSPCADAFDLPGYSWVQDLTGAGFDVWALDFRGFARSSKPQGEAPVGRAADAVRDTGKVIEEIARRTGSSKVSLVAWSWGGVVAPMLASKLQSRIDRMVLFGSMHAFPLASMATPLAAKDEPTRFGPSRTPYQKIETDQALGHWGMMRGEGEDLASLDAVEKAETLIRRCGNAEKVDGKEFVSRPMGPLVDLFEIWSNRPIYDASRVRVPTLVISGDRDVFADRDLPKKLPNATGLVIKDATHWLPFEKNRESLFRATREFLSPQASSLGALR